VLAVGWSAADASVRFGLSFAKVPRKGGIGFHGTAGMRRENGYAMNDEKADQSNESVGNREGSTHDTAVTPSAAPSLDLKTPSAAAPAAFGSNASTSAPKGHGFFRRFFWLDDKIAEASAKGFSKSQPGWPEFELTRQARAGIVQIGETGESNAAVLLLERSEVLFLLRSHLAKHGVPAPGMSLSEDDWTRARQLPMIAEAWAELSGAQQAALLEGLGPRAELALTNLDLKQRRYLASALRKLATTLAEPLERDASLVGRVLFMRWARIGAAALVLLAIAWSIMGMVERRFAKPNIAYGRPVTISSQFGDVALDHSLLVDGDKTNLGFHTNNGPGEWVMIDLGSTRNISKVVVYNRAECCQERAIPIRIEVSDDGTNFKKVADRTEEFDVWTAKGFDVRARYVRVRHLGASYLHFAEIEIY
jgi:hypothetical protein